MERSNKKFIFLTIIMCIFLLAGCNKLRFNTFNASEEENSGSEVTVVPENNENEVKSTESEETNGTTGETGDSEAVTPTPAIQPVANIELPIYTINADTGEIETATALIPQGSEITPRLIVDQVVESLADQSIKVGIEAVDTEDDKVIVSFYHDQAPLNDVGAGYEISILDAIAQSLMDNLDDYTKVIYRKEGEAYVSGHLEYGIDEVYLEDN